jgi:hypothetical protein
MSRWTNGFSLRASVSAAVLLSASAPLLAQQPAPPARPMTYPAAVILGQIGQSAGVTILADSSVQGRLPLPAVPATAATVEQQIAEMVRGLSAGTTWAKLYVPAPANGRWSADVVGNYARALAQVVGTIGRAAPAGMVEILGRNVPADKANDYINALNLKLVYLVTGPTQQPSTNPTANWTQMSPDQRDLYAQQQAQQLMAMNPEGRIQALAQMMLVREESPQSAVMRAVMSQLSDDEKFQLKQSVGAALRGGPAGGK